MSIGSEINRLEGAKEDISTFATNAGISVASTTTLDEIGAALKELTVAPVVQATGSGATSVMSQKAVTNELKKYTSMVPYGTAIAANSDLNTTAFLKVGNYYCSQNASVATLTNCPTTLAFMMQVYSPLSTTIDNETTKTWVYRLRKIITHKGVEYYQFVNSGATAGTFTYGAWIKQANETDVAEKADKTHGIYYVVGNSTTAGTWTGTCDDISEYYDGLTVAYRTNIAGKSGGTTLNINGLGAIAVRRNTSAVTTHYGANTLIHLTYTTIDGVGYWQTADYDSNTKNSAGTTNKVGTKMFLVGATSQGANPTTYSNKNVYIGADNSLYSNGTKVATVNDLSGVSVKDCGAKGDGSTDDTSAFTTALANNRVVFVPGGTYNLNGTLTIRDNCQLRLSQDTVLNFSNTSANCIQMRRSSWLKGDHATINVPYAYTGHVIHASTDVDIVNTSDNNSDVPPWTMWDPQWKTARYVTDINICKPNSSGLNYSTSGEVNGTALYINCDNVDGSRYMWGANMSGLRIAGSFTYGVHIVNENSANASLYAWNHELRLEVVMDACETGVYVEHCDNAFISATIQPRPANNGTVYAKHGIKLSNSKNIDLSSSRVWDWNETATLWTLGGEYQHLALIGQCRGLILSDFIYYESSTDIRDLIYTDTASNLEQMTILQEPITRWFKPKDGLPYFNNGETEKRIALKEDIEEVFKTEKVAKFNDVLATAINSSGAIFNGVGYKKNCYVVLGSGAEATSDYLTCTGFIPCSNGDTIHVEGMTWDNTEGAAGYVAYTSSFERIGQCSAGNALAGNWYGDATKTDNGIKLTVKNMTGCAYVRINFNNAGVSSSPVAAVNQEIAYYQGGFLSEGVEVKGESVVLTSPTGNLFSLSVSDSGVLSATAIS